MKDRFDFTPEEICEFHVSENRKRLWACEIELLEMLEKVCCKYHINYFMIYGAAIGAVRHHGFIPWDDDIDVGMMREDLDILLKVWPEEFPEYVDLQYGIMEQGFSQLARIRDSRTTGITRSELNYKGNKGAFIEVYPYDYVDDNLIRKMQLSINSVLCKHIGQRKWVWWLYEKTCRIQNGKKDRRKYIDTIAIPAYSKENRGMIRVEDVKEFVYLPFEYIKARLPIGYDRCLRIQYGDYMQLPPVEKRGMNHERIVFYDPTKSYKEYEESSVIDQYFRGEVSDTL